MPYKYLYSPECTGNLLGLVLIMVHCSFPELYISFIYPCVLLNRLTFMATVTDMARVTFKLQDAY